MTKVQNIAINRALDFFWLYQLSFELLHILLILEEIENLWISISMVYFVSSSCQLRLLQLCPPFLWISLLLTGVMDKSNTGCLKIEINTPLAAQFARATQLV